MLAAIIAVVAVILDQISKYLVVEAATPIDRMLEGTGDWTQEFIPNLISFSYAENTGGAWSMLNDGGLERMILLGMSFITMGLLVYILAKYYKRHPLMNVALAMVLGGGVGNMIDRIRLGYVVDFLTTEFIEFPIFNVADCFVTVGAILLGVYIIFIEPKIYKREQAENAQLVSAEAAVNDILSNPAPKEPLFEEAVSDDISDKAVPQEVKDDSENE